MFVVRRAVCEVLGRGVRSGPAVSAGRHLIRHQLWSAEKAELTAAGATLVQVTRKYAKATREEPKSHFADLAPTMLKQEYEGVKAVDGVSDVVKRLLSLDMATQSDKLKLKAQQLVDKVKRSPDDTNSKGVYIAHMTAKIQSYMEHNQKHPKDKANKRRMLMLIDKRKKILKNLRLTNFEVFEHVCKQLGIEYTFPPEYYRRATKRWQAKKALCLKVHAEVRKLKAKGLLQKKRRRFRASSVASKP
ncbi:small ribosomal subunit protein uS15m [Hyperolius riggenbachi]|uniref:small ribosomal subunit protein uS15m n=1 Tax=Hyperolius riggenbachi TaxID=752182 RepID=UPI0035A32A0E